VPSSVLTKDTGPCGGCARYFCIDCCESHFDTNSPEYCLGLRIDRAGALNGQLVDPLQVLVGSKILEDLVAEGLVEVVGVDSKGRRLYRKL
jgi:hypothetical protein